jgi:hypothetical protein
MAFPTAYVWIESRSSRLFTISRHPDTPLKCRCERTDYLAAQAHKTAGIGTVNGWHQAGTAQGADPGRAKQAAFFMLATAIIVAVEVFTFRAGRGLHITTDQHPAGMRDVLF